MNKFCKYIIITATFLFIQNVFSQVVINEYSCANSTSAGDPDFYGEMEDWVELYNTSAAAIDLNGYYISDKAGNTTKFQVPSSILIPAGGYMMVYGSGRATIAGGTEIHTGFKWTQTKFEKIVLSDAGGTIIDSLTIIPNQHLHSRGRTTDGAATWSVFTNSTPNGSNTTAMQEYATTPTLSVGAGFFTSAQSVTITTPDPNITIHYTTDGSDPTTGSTVYSGPVNISSTTVLRAKCFSSTPTIPPSFIETNTYFINSSHTVPVISICGNDVTGLLNNNVPGASGGTNYKGSIEYFDVTGSMETEGSGDFNKHGNDSWAYDQRGIDFIMRDQYGYNYALKEKFFANKSRKKFQRIILKAGASDNYPFEGVPNTAYAGELGGAHIRDSYVHALSQNGDLYLDERTHLSCILYVDGQYWGVYEIREKVDDSDFMDYYYDQDEQFVDSDNYIQYLARWGGTGPGNVPAVEYGNDPGAYNDWLTLLSYITNNNMAIQTNFDSVTSLYKWKSLVDYFVLNSYVVSHDMLSWNTSWWRGLDPNGSKKKWRYSLWDMDATFNHYTNYTGIPNTGANADPCDIDNLADPGGDGHTVILNALMDNAGFEQYYISRYIDLSNTTFKCTNMIAVLDSLINIITPEMPGQIARWGGTMAEWTQNVQDMRDFINTRCTALNQGLVNCYNVTGPFPLQVNVNPVGAGDVKVNSITPASYVYSGNYFGNIDILLKASENLGYTFSHWEVFNHTLDSATTNKENSLQITQTDSIVAHYVIEDTVALIFNVDPVVGGNISINGFTPSAYSYSKFYPKLSVLNLVATPQPGYLFVNWTSNSTPFTALSTDPSVTIAVDQMDSIVAHFAIIDTFEIEFRVMPETMGQIDIDTNSVFDDLTITIITKQYITGVVVDLEQTPISNYLFDRWETIHHTLTPSSTSTNVSFTVTGNDIVRAYYVPPPPPKAAAVPMAFSPNDDGNNDILYVYGGQIESLSFDVYDRWGERVFTSSSIDKGWDGFFNGKKASSGVYVYKMRAVFSDGDLVNKTGNITLVR
ncbi:MAG: hypothetical protein COB15_07730 [Flavobacteriales bacterium]|nr:MAG: hypothetical protein COB15_07730 [Flavobacteriales bacterium]